MRIVLTHTLFAVASAALTAGALLVSVPASAATQGEVLTRHAEVTYADLDLTTPAARATLQTRIHAAAGTVCAVEDSDVASRLASAACRKQAIADATRRMDTVLAQAATAKRIALR
jgi:UrcA family protein